MRCGSAIIFRNECVKHGTEKAYIVGIARTTLDRIHVMTTKIPPIHSTGIDRDVPLSVAQLGEIGFEMHRQTRARSSTV
jgi:hypothetical protein